jgi:shikimate kinase
VRILLVGLMGSGKSTVGRRLSARTGWAYLDNDRLVVQISGRHAPDIIASDGEAALHAIEAEAFELALTEPTPVIVGLAGWLVTDADRRARIRDAGTVVWLRAAPDTLRTRAGSGRGRRPEALASDWIERTAADRAPMFDDVADLVIDVDLIDVAEVVERIVAGIPSIPDERG